MRVEFSPLAIHRLLEIHDWLASRNPSAADRVLVRIRHCSDLLADQPKMGRPDGSAGRRSFDVSGTPFRIHYRIDETAKVVEITTIAHVRQRWPRLR